MTPLTLVYQLGNFRETIRTHFVSFLFLLLAVCLAFVLFYPGSMSLDSWFQYDEARSGMYTDSHPPIMAWIWSLFLLIKDGPEPMFFFHLIMFWGGLFLIWYQSIRKGYKLYILAPLIGFLPPVLSMGGVIWKDIGLGSSLVLVLGLLFCWNRRRNWLFYFIYFFLFYATAVRKNSLAATIPFFVFVPVFLFSYQGLKNPFRAFKLAAFGFFLFVVTLFLIGIFEDNFLNAKKEHFGQTVLFHDLAYIGFHENVDLVPLAFKTSKYSRKTLAHALEARGDHGALFRRDDSPLKLSENESDLRELKWLWIQSVLRYPKRYLELRTLLFKDILSIGFGPYQPIHYFMPSEFVGRFSYFDPVREAFKTILVQSPIKKLVFSGWIYLLLAVSGLFFVSVNLTSHSWLGMICFISAILYTATYFPASVACDFRYLWLLTVLGPLGWVFTLGTRD